MKSKKLLTSAVALGTAAALTLGGTFAWQSISQKALNEASDIVNPGGRLHNDQNWVSAKVNNNDIYVENFTDPENGGQDIFARVRLSEYMEIVMNKGVEGAEVVETVVGKKTLDGVEVTDKATDNTSGYEYEYVVHKFTEDDATNDFFTWSMGSGETEEEDLPYYIPTFNLNKDSLLADLNGTYVDAVGGISNRGEAQYEWDAITSESTADGYEVFDNDTNKLDEVGRADLKDLIENGTSAENYETLKEAIVLSGEQQTHTAKQVGATKGFISMEEWWKLAATDGYVDEDGLLTTEGEENLFGYWVYDEDGWVYWSAPIAAGETTGLLLDGFSLNHIMDDTWYYAIDVTAQFVTADDVGKNNDTGFYALDTTPAAVDEDGETAETAALPVSEEAEALLELIGVHFPKETADDDTDDGDNSTPGDDEETGIVIHKDDTAEAVSYTLAPATYDITAEDFSGDVTYTVAGANRCKVKNGSELIVNKYESATSFTVTATDSDGNTGTVTITLKDNDPTELPFFDLYKVENGEAQWVQTVENGDELTMTWTAGDTYRIVGDFSMAADDEFRVSVGNEGGGFADASTSEIYLAEGNAHVTSTIIRWWDPDFDTSVTQDEWTGDTVDVMTLDAAAGKTYVLSFASNSYQSECGYEGAEITITIASTDNGATGTPKPDAEGNITETVTVTDENEENTLKVQYKRAQNAVYMAGSGTVEFKLKPEYNGAVVTDTDQLTLTVNVDGEDKVTVTGNSFQASTSDGDGWLKCTVSDLFTDKTDDVAVNLTLTYKDGATELTTQAYEIKFTCGGFVS